MEETAWETKEKCLVVFMDHRLVDLGKHILSSSCSTINKTFVFAAKQAKQVTCEFAACRNGYKVFINTAHIKHEELDATIKIAEPGKRDFGGRLSRYKLNSSLDSRYQDIWHGKKVSYRLGD